MITISILAMVIYLFGGFADSPNHRLTEVEHTARQSDLHTGTTHSVR
jgi:hypothetical protein